MPIREKRRRASMSGVRMVTRSAAKRKAVDHIDTTSSASISKKDAGGDENVIDDLPELAVERQLGCKKMPREDLQPRLVSRRRELKQTGEVIDDRIFEPQGEDDNKTIKELEMEVEALKSRCNGYEREIRDLQGTCDTHEKVLEMLRQQIMHLMDAQGIPNTTYGGKSYDLIP
ncbi:hypothetical protein EI94DRAFT_1708999 [Lactarius quietus]|nr:hypothetical protein EI94DRAFT_1708999 [Lactarius quietus]